MSSLKSLLGNVDDLLEQFFVLVVKEYPVVSADKLREIWNKHSPNSSVTSTTKSSKKPAKPTDDSDDEPVLTTKDLLQRKATSSGGSMCQYEFKRGINAGKKCGKKVALGSNSFCSVHKKSESGASSPAKSTSSVSISRPTIVKHPGLNVYYHKETGLVFKSAEKQYVVGILKKDKVAKLDDVDVDLAKQYRFMFMATALVNPEKYSKDSNLKTEVSVSESSAESEAVVKTSAAKTLSQLSDGESSSDDEAPPAKPVAKPAPAKKQVKEDSSDDEAPPAKPVAKPAPAKKQVKEDSSDDEAPPAKPVAKTAPAKKPQVKEDSSDDEAPPAKPVAKPVAKTAPAKKQVKEDSSDDETPPAKPVAKPAPAKPEVLSASKQKPTLSKKSATLSSDDEFVDANTSKLKKSSVESDDSDDEAVKLSKTLGVESSDDEQVEKPPKKEELSDSDIELSDDDEKPESSDTETD